MKAITLHRESEHRGTFAFVFEPDEDPVALLVTAASEYQLTRCQITAIGGFSSATLGYFDHTRREYLTIALREQVEVLSLLGDVAHDDGKRVIHVNCVVGLRDGTTRGGASPRREGLADARCDRHRVAGAGHEPKGIGSWGACVSATLCASTTHSSRSGRPAWRERRDEVRRQNRGHRLDRAGTRPLADP